MLQCLGLVMGNQRINDLIDIALKNLIEFIQGQTDTMIGYPSLGKIICSNPAAAIAGAHLALSLRGPFFVFLPDLLIQKPRPKHFRGFGPVLDLRLFILAGHDQAGWQMGNADRRIGGIDALTARTGRAIYIHFDITGVDMDIHCSSFPLDRNGNRRGVNPPLSFGNPHPLNTMGTAFEFESAVGARTVNHHDDFLKTAHTGGTGTH